MSNKSMEHANTTDVEEDLVLASKLDGPNEKYTNRWYLDTRCNNHMCGKREFFSHLDEFVGREVKFRNKSKTSVMSKGDISFQSKDGTNVTISNVYFM